MSEFPPSPSGRQAGASARGQQGAPGQGEQQVPASVRGAVDLGAATGGAAAGGAPQAAQAASTAANTRGGSYRVALNTGNFQQYAEASTQYPVVVVLHAAQSPESESFVDLVAKVVDGFDGRLLLGTVDTAAEPQIAQAFQAQSVPTVLALLGGRVVPLVTSTVPEEQLRGLLGELLGLAAQNGVTGTAEPTDAGNGEPAPLPPLHQEAVDKLEAGDLDGAEAAYRRRASLTSSRRLWTVSTAGCCWARWIRPPSRRSRRHSRPSRFPRCSPCWAGAWCRS